MGMGIWLLLVLAAAGRNATATPRANATSVLDHILTNYHTSIIPGDGKGVEVRLQMSIQNVIELDTAEQTFTIQAWFRHYWVDERLRWDPEDFGDTTSIFVPRSQIWIPDAEVYEVVEQNQPFEAQATVYSSGDVFFSQPASLKVHCLMDLSLFPFDTQVCEFTLGSWSMHGLQLDLLPRVDGDGREVPATVDSYKQHTEFNLVRVRTIFDHVYYSCCPEPYPNFRVSITLQREALAYLYSIVIPILVATLVGFTAFVLSPDSGERISLSVTVLLTVAAIYFVAHNDVPKVGRFTMISSLYLVAQMMMLMVVLCSIIVVSLHAVKDSQSFAGERRLLEMFRALDEEKSDELELSVFLDGLDGVGLDPKVAGSLREEVTRVSEKRGIGTLLLADWAAILARRQEGLTLNEAHSPMIRAMLKASFWLSARVGWCAGDPRVLRVHALHRRAWAERALDAGGVQDSARGSTPPSTPALRRASRAESMKQATQEGSISLRGDTRLKSAGANVLAGLSLKRPARAGRVDPVGVHRSVADSASSFSVMPPVVVTEVNRDSASPGHQPAGAAPAAGLTGPSPDGPAEGGAAEGPSGKALLIPPPGDDAVSERSARLSRSKAAEPFKSAADLEDLTELAARRVASNIDLACSALLPVVFLVCVMIIWAPLIQSTQRGHMGVSDEDVSGSAYASGERIKVVHHNLVSDVRWVADACLNAVGGGYTQAACDAER
mmetsp:Transcript_20506/g.60537  ORF Transcript_20506/g.60537 Transcript_20506/m.60537 type:complete len:723 (+) Transcript_20506:21-2189(+)